MTDFKSSSEDFDDSKHPVASNSRKFDFPSTPDLFPASSPAGTSPSPFPPGTRRRPPTKTCRTCKGKFTDPIVYMAHKAAHAREKTRSRPNKKRPAAVTPPSSLHSMPTQDELLARLEQLDRTPPADLTDTPQRETTVSPTDPSPTTSLSIFRRSPSSPAPHKNLPETRDLSIAGETSPLAASLLTALPSPQSPPNSPDSFDSQDPAFLEALERIRHPGFFIPLDPLLAANLPPSDPHHPPCKDTPSPDTEQARVPLVSGSVPDTWLPPCCLSPRVTIRRMSLPLPGSLRLTASPPRHTHGTDAPSPTSPQDLTPSPPGPSGLFTPSLTDPVSRSAPVTPIKVPSQPSLSTDWGPPKQPPASTVVRPFAEPGAASEIPSPFPSTNTRLATLPSPNQESRRTYSEVAALPPSPRRPATPSTQPSPAPGAVIRSGNTLRLWFPTHPVFKCPEANCKTTFAFPKWRENCRRLIQHLQIVHATAIITIKRMCTTCHGEVAGRLHLHPCLAKQQIVMGPSVTPSSQTPPQVRCNFCERPFPTRKALKYHLERVHKIPPKAQPLHAPVDHNLPGPSRAPNIAALDSQDDFRNSPRQPTSTGLQQKKQHRAPQPQDPVTAPPLASTIIPPSYGRIDNIIHISFPRADTFPCTEAGCRATFRVERWSASVGTLKRHLQDQHHLPDVRHLYWCSHCHRKISTISTHPCFDSQRFLFSSGDQHPGTRVSPSPDRPDHHRPSSTQDPITRSGPSLNFKFPLPDLCKCPEVGCSRSFRASTWTSIRTSLIKHLHSHSVKISSTSSTCTLCNGLMGLRPSRHRCFRDRPFFIPTTEASSFPCQHCSFSATTAKGIQNHIKSHTREANRAAAPALDVRMPKRRIPRKRDRPQSPEAGEVTNPDSPGRIGFADRSPCTNIAGATTVEPPPAQFASHGPDMPTAGDANIQPSPSSQVTAPDDPEPTLLSEFSPLLNDILNSETSAESFDHFIEVLGAITNTITREKKIRQPAERTSGSRPSANPKDPTTIQKWYRRNRRAAVRAILQDSGDRCRIPHKTIEEHFASDCDPTSTCPEFFPPCTIQREPILGEPFTTEEVLRSLRSAENSAPGPDRITYHHWREADPEGLVLTSIFNTCLHFQAIPPSWKSSVTVLIPKAGDPSDITNWRPIALSNTAYKLFSKCLARRLSTWCSANNILSPSQKGFTPHDGVIEHNYYLQARMEEARAHKKDLCIAWLDIANAFGSVPHSAINQALSSIGADDCFRRIIEDLYTDSTTQFLTEEGLSSTIRSNRGVKQGCPLSGALFNLCLNPALNRLNELNPGVPDEDQETQTHHNILAFADDACLLADSPTALQEMLNTFAADIRRINLILKPQKSASLHLSGQKPTGSRMTMFNIEGTDLQPLHDSESHRFLGKPTGFNIVPGFASLNETIEVGRRLVTSALSQWQVFDAMKTFFYPALQFSMRTAQFPKGAWTAIDEALRPLLRQVLSVPDNASTAYLYGPRRRGCCGVPSAAEDSDIFLVDTAFKLLTSRDDATRTVAEEHLSTTVTRRLRRPCLESEIPLFLSGDMEDDFDGTTNAFQNVWTLARSASRRLGVTWSITQGAPCLHIQQIALKACARTKVAMSLHTILRDRWFTTLKEQKNQGKTIECVAMSPASTHFFRDGFATRFADWRFIHKARLNLVPLNAAKPWLRGHNKSCRRCGEEDETLPHVLNHCKPALCSMTRRHNSIVARIATAADRKCSRLYENQAPVPGLPLRPDLILRLRDTTYILDVTIPFENGPQAFQEARSRKISKYAPLVSAMRSLPGHAIVEIVPIVVGSLGSWDPQNDSFLKKICSRSYLRLFRKLCVSDTIRWSRDICIEHLTGIRQYSASPDGNDVAPPNINSAATVDVSPEEALPTQDSMTADSQPDNTQ